MEAKETIENIKTLEQDEKEYLAISDLAKQIGIDRSYAFKDLDSRGFEVIKLRIPWKGNQKCNCLTVDKATEWIQSRINDGFHTGIEGEEEAKEPRHGVFYFIQVMPENRPERIKIGHTRNKKNRLSDFRSISPQLKVLKTWPCKEYWEQTVIDILSTLNCEHIGGEVFEFEDVDKVLEYCEKVFDMLPDL